MHLWSWKVLEFFVTKRVGTLWRQLHADNLLTIKYFVFYLFTAVQIILRQLKGDRMDLKIVVHALSICQLSYNMS